jgi:hypothetical protein
MTAQDAVIRRNIAAIRQGSQAPMLSDKVRRDVRESCGQQSRTEFGKSRPTEAATPRRLRA